METQPVGIAETAEYVRRLLSQKARQAFPACAIAAVPVDASSPDKTGFFSSSLPFQIAGKAGIAPEQAAKCLADQIQLDRAVFSRVEPAGGFLHFYPADPWYTACAAALPLPDTSLCWAATEEDFARCLPRTPAQRQIQQTFLRLCSVLRNCKAEGMLCLPCPDAWLSLLCAPSEQRLIFSLCRLAESDPAARTVLLLETARSFSYFYDMLRIWAADPRRTAARAALSYSCGVWMQTKMEQAGLFPR